MYISSLRGALVSHASQGMYDLVLDGFKPGPLTLKQVFKTG